MSRIIDDRSTLDRTVKLYDAFYAFDQVINGSEYDIVFSYFKSVNDSTVVSENFAAALFAIAQNTGTPALELLGYIQGTTKLEMNQIITYYLNSFKSKTTLYGISVIPQPNQSVQRNVVI